MPDSATAYAPGVFAPGHLGELTQIVSFELVDEVLAEAGGLQQRVRGLPSRVVVYLVLAGALFESMGWPQVWARLTASLPDRRRCPAKSSITEAMRRVGSKPLKILFDLVKGPVAVATATRVVRFAGRLVVAIDGTQVPLPDTEANRVVFPKPRGGPNGQAGYPMLRMVALVVCGTRSILEAVFGSDQVGELTYASRLATALKPQMILLADRNFYATGFIATVAATGGRLPRPSQDPRDRATTPAPAATARRHLPVPDRLSHGPGHRSSHHGDSEPGQRPTAPRAACLPAGHQHARPRHSFRA